MGTIIYDEPWNPSNINCNWKPEKLSRYSFVSNMIDFNAAGIALGYQQNGKTPVINSLMNLTDYIEVNSDSDYYLKYENNVRLGIRYICFFNSEKEFISSMIFNKNININPSLPSSLEEIDEINFFNPSILNEEAFYTPINCAYIRITMYKAAWKRCSLRADYSNSLVGNSKDITPLNIVDNVAGAQIYKDLHFEVYVKAEALVKNFVDNFDLSAFQAFPDEGNSSVYSSTNNLLFVVNNPLGNWLIINKNVKETNYSETNGFVGYLLFKNLWGCDMGNYLETFVNKAYLTITYQKIFAKNLRMNEIGYDKFFNQGYFDNALNYSGVDGFGVRLIRGESFRNDSILGDFIVNNYLTYTEQITNVAANDPTTDNVNNNYFGGRITKPFDHYYSFEPKVGIPFFKEKTFEDFKLECTLQKEDRLGNIFKRIVKLPIYVKFYNNLIKCYFRNGHTDDLGKYYDIEYLNSNQENEFSVERLPPENSTGGSVVSRVTIWCPNVNKISVSSRIVGPLSYTTPTISEKNGQVCMLKWTFANTKTPGVVMKAIHTIEYSDGENYDKFTYIEKIEII